MSKSNQPHLITRTMREGNTSVASFTNLRAAQGFSYVYGFHPTVRVMDEFNKIKTETARDWWERSGVEQQCNNVIGQFVPGTICYICGCPILGIAECEHILSVFKAAMFLHLYRNDFKINRMGRIEDSNGQPFPRNVIDRMMLELLLEYKWAHRCCNQVKSNTDFIRFNGKSFEFDEHNATVILEGILNLSELGKGDICNDKNLKECLNLSLIHI